MKGSRLVTIHINSLARFSSRWMVWDPVDFVVNPLNKSVECR